MPSGVRIFFAFDNEHVIGSEHRRQLVRHQTHAVHVPDPSAAAVWPALAEVFVLAGLF